MKITTHGLVAILACLACKAPPIIESPGNAEPSGILTGTLTVVGSTAVGDAYLLLVPQPGEPGACPATGTSAAAPKDIIRIPESDLFRDEGGFSHSVPFTIPQVPTGCWSIVALVDADDDFNPLFGVTAGSTHGDGLGGAVSPCATQEGMPCVPPLRVLSVSEDSTYPEAVDGIQVIVGTDAPFERPSFTVSAVGDGSLTLQTDAVAPVAIELEAAPLTGEWVSTADPDKPSAPMFPIFLNPATGDVVATPQVLLRRLASDGSVPPWAKDTEFPLILAAQVDTTPFKDIEFVPGQPIHLTSTLRVFVVPKAFIPPAPGLEPELIDLADVGAQLGQSAVGRYSIFVRVAATNQTWELPNELVVLEGNLSQGKVFTVEDPE